MRSHRSATPGPSEADRYGEAIPRPPPNLAVALLAAADWFNDALQAHLVAKGWPRISRSQGIVMTRIDAGGTRPAELARRLDMARQSMIELLRSMEELGLLSLDPDPDDNRALVARLTERAHALGRDAGLAMQAIEGELADRIGDSQRAALVRVLTLDWGPPPTP